jgi:hypothetical protein
MAMAENQERIEKNLSVIRHYLKCKFPGCDITEQSIPSRYQEFIVSYGTPFQSHKLKVDWSQLSQRKNTPERMLFLLHSNYVADWMVRAGHEYYSWNPTD